MGWEQVNLLLQFGYFSVLDLQNLLLR